MKPHLSQALNERLGRKKKTSLADQLRQRENKSNIQQLPEKNSIVIRNLDHHVTVDDIRVK